VHSLSVPALSERDRALFARDGGPFVASLAAERYMKMPPYAGEGFYEDIGDA
jgi:hypothetical protein